MGWLSIWHWVLTAIFIAMPLAYIAVAIVLVARRARAESTASGLNGGLLAVIAVQLLLFGSVGWHLLDLFESYDTVKGTQNGALATGGQIVLFALVALVIFYTAVLLFRRNRNFPILFTVQWAVLALAVVFNFFWEAWALNIEYRQLARFYDEGTVLHTVIAAVISALTIFYLFSGSRPRNTFVR